MNIIEYFIFSQIPCQLCLVDILLALQNSERQKLPFITVDITHLLFWTWSKYEKTVGMMQGEEVDLFLIFPSEDGLSLHSSKFF